MIIYDHIEHDTTKPVFGVSDKAVFTATETS